MSKKNFSQQEIIDKINDKKDFFYKLGVLNYTGCAKIENDERAPVYCEVISDIILKNKDIIDFPLKKEGRLRETFSFSKRKKGTDNLLSETNLRKEEMTCFQLYKEKSVIEDYGRIVFYQVTLVKHIHMNIDLIARDDDHHIIWLIEVKGNNIDKAAKSTSKETLLRAAIEIETYYRTVVNNGLKDNLFDLRYNNTLIFDGDVHQYSLGKLILAPENTQAYEDYKNLSDLPKLKNLLDQLDIKFAVLW